ncbi:hypothetical protein ACFL16_03555 [Patescibacteria group bacterium]
MGYLVLVCMLTVIGVFLGDKVSTEGLAVITCTCLVPLGFIVDMRASVVKRMLLGVAAVVFGVINFSMWFMWCVSNPARISVIISSIF